MERVVMKRPAAVGRDRGKQIALDAKQALLEH
jgi:hypothetical protein